MTQAVMWICMNDYMDPDPEFGNFPYGSKSGSKSSRYGSKEKIQFQFCSPKFNFSKQKNHNKICCAQN